MKSSMIFGDDKLRLGVGVGSAVGHSVGDRSEWHQHGKNHNFAMQAMIVAHFSLVDSKRT